LLNKLMFKHPFFLFLLMVCLSLLTGMSEAVGIDEKLDISSGPSLKLSAYTQAGYTRWEQDKKGFRIRQARVQLKGDILKNIDYKLQIDATQSPILLDAKIGVNLSPYANLSFGQFKVPFSIENLISGSELDTINRSNTVNNLCPARDIGTQGRDIGFTISGKYSILEYTLGVFNGAGKNKKDTNDQLDVAGRLVLTPFRSFSIGLSHYKGRYNPEAGLPILENNRTGVDILLLPGRFSLKGEYIFVSDDQIERYGWYLQGGYYLIPKTLEAIVKHDYFDGNRTVREDQIVVTTLGINYFFSRKTKIQVNYEHRRGGSLASADDVILAQIQAGF
jgi:phosphate-selective porin OprO/OprP